MSASIVFFFPDVNNTLRNVTLRLHKVGADIWWSLNEETNDTLHAAFLNKLPAPSQGPGFSPTSYLMIYTFNDKTFPATLSMFSGKGIIGLYTTFVLVASQFVRNFFSGLSSKIMFEDLPCVDRILQVRSRQMKSFKLRLVTACSCFSSAWISTWCARAESWILRKTCLPNWCSCTDHQRR